ncbi:MAG: methylmalonyl Co-A mutase-associated GTPase MeaB [Syntrophobacteraceae bacterium]
MDIIQKIVSGDVRTIARILRDIDDELPSARSVLQGLYPHTGKAHIVGFTGSPGVGKSSLVDQIATFYRKQSKTVGILAVDPTSPFTGGAILGDRIRMQRHFLDPGVFIRSLATRGQFGGLSKSTNDMVNVLDAAGKDLVLVETVGVGQDEVEIANSAHTTVLVMIPGMGDDIQAIKAGVMEIGNIFVVNKADREGSRKTVRELMNLVEIGVRRRNGDEWEPQIIETEAVKGRGIEKLCQTIEDHKAYLKATGSQRWRETVKKRTRIQLMGALRDRALKAVLEKIEQRGDCLDDMVAKIVDRQSDPYTVVQQIVESVLR